MVVTIKEKEYEYISDYPDGWSFSARDHFKCPVEIGPNKCFIKRFDRKNQNEVPGWELMLNLKRKNEPNLPRLYDITTANEWGKDVYYIFYDYIKGDTLDKLIDGKENINLEKLANDLFSALQSLYIKNFWFADFCEKNIFCEEGGRFLLVDLDSAQPLSNPPNGEMYGSKEYRTLVFNFYREILHKRNLNADDINGASLNYLQVVFLILRLKMLYAGDLQYYSPEIYNLLPQTLDTLSPGFEEIYSDIFRNGQIGLPQRDIQEIKRLALEIISGENILHSTPEEHTNFNYDAKYNHQPVIQQFSMDKFAEKDNDLYYVDNGEPFTLNWKVENADILELYKNGTPYRKLDNSGTAITLKELSDGSDRKIEYKLQASAKDMLTVSNPILVLIKKKGEPLPEIIEFKADVTIIHDNEPYNLRWAVKNATHLELHRNGANYKTISSSDKAIQLKEYPVGNDEQNIRYVLVVFNNAGEVKSPPVFIQVRKKNVEKPPINWSLYLKIACCIAAAFILYLVAKWMFMPVPDPGTKVTIIEPQNLYEDSSIIIHGAQFDKAKKMEVFFNDMEGDIISTTKDNLIVKIPDLKNNIQIKGIVTVSVKANGYNLYAYNVHWFDKNTPAVRELKTVNFYANNTITVYGINLDKLENMRIYFNSLQGNILTQTKDSVVVSVPQNIFKDSSYNSVTVTVAGGHRTLYNRTFTP